MVDTRHVHDTWGLQLVDKQYARGMVRVKDLDTAKKMLKSSGRLHAIWFLEPASWETFAGPPLFCGSRKKKMRTPRTTPFVWGTCPKMLDWQGASS